MSRMLREAQEAPERVRELMAHDADVYAGLGARLRQLAPSGVITIARGSSDHAASYASYLIPLCTGRLVASLAPSLVSVLGVKPAVQGQLALAISQGGRSPDLNAALQAVKDAGALTAAIVNDSASPLAERADVVLPQRAGPEGIAATKSMLCSLSAIARMCAAWANDARLRGSLETLPQQLERAFDAGAKLDTAPLQKTRHVYTVSRGLGLSAALEAALKLKETCGIHAEAFSTAEVLHGPREIVGDAFLVIAIAIKGSGYEDTLATAQTLQEQGARVVVIEPVADNARIAPIVALQMIYPWLARASVDLGRDPDNPKTLKSKIIETF